MKANLCRCNNCDSILIDKNPQKDAIEHELTGNELEMQWTGGLIEFKHDPPMWVCPLCMTNAYLIDM